MSQPIYIALGANLGDTTRTLHEALRALEHQFGPVTSSAFYSTQARMDLDQPSFLNAVARCHSALTPQEILRHLQAIERQLGRTRDPLRPKGPRQIDLDLLMVGTHQCDTQTLTLPHPGLHQRRFVLRPLCELAPDLVPPGMTHPVRVLLDQCLDEGWVHPLPSRISP